MTIPENQMIGIVMALAVGAASAGCELVNVGPRTAPKSVDGQPVYYRESAKYNQRVSQLALTPEQARDALIAFRQSEPGVDPSRPLLIGDHEILVGDEYVFSIPEKQGISRRGWYVNGNTGDVRFVTAPSVP